MTSCLLVEDLDVGGHETLVALFNAELDALVLFEVTVTGTNDVAVVRKYIFRAVLGANEAVALLGVKSFTIPVVTSAMWILFSCAAGVEPSPSDLVAVKLLRCTPRRIRWVLLFKLKLRI